MKRTTIYSLIITVLLVIGSTFQSQAGGEEGGKFDAGEMIMHHIADSHEWHLVTTKDDDGKEHHVSIPLPIILITDGNFDVFLSSAFHHGQEAVTKGDRVYVLDAHGHILEKSGKKVMDFSITKNAASMMVAALLMLLVFPSIAGAYKKRQGQAPKGLQSLLEPLITFIIDDVAKANIGEKKYLKFAPYLLTVFFFVWFNNLLGLFPGGANASGNINFTVVLAIITFFITNFAANKGYWGHIFMPPGVPLWLYPLIVPIELISIFTKPFALMIRLFANITAGHIIILSLFSFIFIFESWAVGVAAGGFAVIMTFLELLVAFLQAYIFTLLSAIFISLATAEHEHHEHKHAH